MAFRLARDLLDVAADTQRPPTEAIVRRGRRRVRRRRALVSVVTVAGVLAVAGVVRATAPSGPTPTVVNTPTGTPTPSPETATEGASATARPDEGGSAMTMRLASGDPATEDVAYLDPADTGDDLVAGVSDVLHGIVDGEPVAVELTDVVDRQQVQPGLVQDPTDPAVVYYAAVIGLEDCIANSTTGCGVRHAVRRVDLRSGTDELVVEDAMSVAVQGTDGEWTPWTSEPGRYHLHAWANQDIVGAVDTGGRGEGPDDLILIDGPGSSRPLVDHGSDRIALLDLSPTGGQALVGRSLGDCCDAALLLVELDTGTILDQLAYRAPGPTLSGPGAWLGQSAEAVVAVTGGPLTGGALQRITTTGGELTADPPLPIGTEQTFSIYAIAASASPDRVAMVLGDRAEHPEGYDATCRIRERRCQYHGIGSSPHAAQLAELPLSPAG